MAKKQEESKHEIAKIPSVTKIVLKKNKFNLKTDVIVGDEVFKKGTSIELTEKQQKYFKTKNYI